MNKRSSLLWSFVATLFLTGISGACQGAGITRMNIPFMLGTMLTPQRDRAKLLGFGLHMANGWVFGLLYAAALESWQRGGWWRGGIIGLVHGLFVLVAGVSLLPLVHPRMANEQYGPTPTQQLEPPGFLALNYGLRTPAIVLVAHLVYGAVIGQFYKLRNPATDPST
jgi:hypothetical protein